jgi:RNA polymerase sigma-70 factor (ECF subfamily)
MRAKPPAGATRPGSMEAIAVTGRSEDLAVLLDSHLAAAYRLACAIVIDDGEAEDVVQEACLIAWKKRGALRDPARLEAWFDRIVVNLCRDRVRRRRRIREITPAAWAGAATDSSVATPADAIDLDLDAALDALDVDHRVVILLRYWQDRTVEDIAARLEIPSGTVKSRLHYALRAMRSRLEAGDGRS